MTVEPDHLVVAGATLAQAIEYVADLTGVAPRPGGRHVAMGTHNAVVRLGTRVYLELIATDPGLPRPPRPRWFDLDDPALQAELGDRPRVIHWVARTADLERTVVLVTSEFARTPKLNGRGGRDHWFANSMLVFGSALAPGVFGATGTDNLGLQAIDFATGQPSATGTVLKPEHVGATLIAAVGGDPTPFRVSPIDALIPGRS